MALSVFNRPDASFEYPSIATTSEYCIGFWSSVQIPNEVFRQFSAVQEQRLAEEARLKASESFYAWMDALPEEPDEEDKESKWVELRNECLSEYEAFGMDPRDVPVIARAALMYHNAPSEAYPIERETVMDYEVQLVGGPTTVEELVERYGTEEFYESVSTLPPPAPAVDPTVVEMIDQLRGSLAKLDALEALDEIKKQNDKTIKLQETIALGAQRQMDKMNSDRENALIDDRMRKEAAVKRRIEEDMKLPWQRNKN